MSAVNDTKYDIEVRTGTDFLVSLLLLDEVGAAVDTTDWTTHLTLPFTGTAEITANRIDVRVAADVSDIPEGFALGEWSLDVTRQDGFRINLLSGVVSVV